MLLHLSQPMFVVQKLSLKSTVGNIETESATSAFLFSSFPSFHSLYFFLSLFCWCDFRASETPPKTPFGQMVASFSSYA